MRNATPAQIETFKNMIADRQWDTCNVIDDRLKQLSSDYLENILALIVFGPEQYDKDDLSKAINDLRCFKGWNRRTYEDATRLITEDQMWNVHLKNENAKLKQENERLKRAIAELVNT